MENQFYVSNDAGIWPARETKRIDVEQRQFERHIEARANIRTRDREAWPPCTGRQPLACPPKPWRRRVTNRCISNRNSCQFRNPSKSFKTPHIPFF